jgi:hypothetical protein
MTDTNATCTAFDPVFDGPADDPANYCNDCGMVRSAHRPAGPTYVVTVTCRRNADFDARGEVEGAFLDRAPRLRSNLVQLATAVDKWGHHTVYGVTGRDAANTLHALACNAGLPVSYQAKGN